MTVTYLDRAAWGAGPITVGYSAPHSQFLGIVVHHTVFILSDYDRDGHTHGDLDDIRRYMQVLKTLRPDLGPDVPYSFVVFEGARPDDCVVAEGRGFGRTGAHTSGFNSSRYGVALAGNSSTRPVTEGVLAGYRWVGARLANPVFAQPTIGHRDTRATECPGTSLYAALPQIQPPFADPEEDDEMTEDDWQRLSRLVDGRLRDPDNLSVITDAVLARLDKDLDPKSQGTRVRRTLLEMAERGVDESLRDGGSLDRRLKELAPPAETADVPPSA